ncbi:MAG: DUF3078 domain-containing protein [Saprospiraceae bacterium]
MRKGFTLLLFLLVFTTAWSQNAESDTIQGWRTGAGVGFDFAQLFQLNPRQGAGQNRLGFGGATNIFAKYRKNRLAWDNLGNWQFGLQRLGSGVIAQGTTQQIPFQKAIDEFRLNSKLGFKASETSKFFYTADFFLFSQITPTYNDPALPGNFPGALSDTSNLLSRFFAPATITLSTGIDYKPNPKISFYYSPIAAKFIIVANDEIAATGVQGNPVTRNASGTIVDFENVDAQFGSLMRINYTSKFLQDRLAYTSALLLFSNYVNDPQNIDVDWTNELALNIFKGLQLSLTANIFYDHDIQVQITDYDAPNGVSGLGRRVSLTQQLLLKYNVVF